MAHQTTWNADGCHLTVFGNLDGAELRTIDHEMYGDEQFDGIHYFVRDLRRVESNRLRPTDMLEAAYINKVASSYKPHLRGAFIVSDPVTESHVQNYIQQSRQAGNPWTMQVFHDPEAALQWATAKVGPFGQ